MNIEPILSCIEKRSGAGCDKILRDPETVSILKDETDKLEKELKVYEGMIATEKSRKQKQQDYDKRNEKVTELEGKITTLKDNIARESKSAHKKEIADKISKLELNIAECDNDIERKNNEKRQTDIDIKNKEDSLNQHKISLDLAKAEVDTAIRERESAKKVGTGNSCWGGYSPELNNGCVERHNNNVRSKEEARNARKAEKEKVEREINSYREKNEKLTQEINELTTKKKGYVEEKDGYIKERQGIDLTIDQNKINEFLKQQNDLESTVNEEKKLNNQIHEEILRFVEGENKVDIDEYEGKLESLDLEHSEVSLALHSLIELQSKEVAYDTMHTMHQEL